MATLLTRCFRQAVARAAVTRRELAEEADYSPGSFYRYLSDRPASADVALALARALDERAARLDGLAQKLREVVARERHRPALPGAQPTGARRPPADRR